MYADDDFNLIDPTTDLESPLDQWDARETEEAAQPQVDPEEMLALLTSEDRNQRMLAARAFCELQDARATPQLIQLLKEGCPLVRVSAAYALGRNPSAEAVLPLIQQLDQDWNGYVRKGVVWALGNCHDPRALTPLVIALGTDISAVRLWAASALGQVTDLGLTAIQLAIPALVMALAKDAVAAVRSNCAWALGQLCQTLPLGELYDQAVAGLIQSLSEADMGVKEDSKAALLRLGDPRGLQAIEELELEGLL
jgi:HEAT repeat protein